ncbi:hypothetical protein BDN70DRAFT_886370 [Pholiota conissans]|uniref:Antifreeze protein n=1 Tax=Pholiota conissans TaxID=109636 RepID=A0A9P5YQT5_9AGAR|nr:hypothetical protein BDN70DRAFT_886370 [Pholiota conissans]
MKSPSKFRIHRITQGALLLSALLCEATGPPGPVLPSLGTAASFNVFAANSITSLAPFALGNVGLYDSDSSSFSYTQLGTTVPFTKDASGKFGNQFLSATCFSTDLSSPTPSILGNAAADFQAAFDNATALTQSRIMNLGNGQIGGQALTPGLYHWPGNVVAATNFTAVGGPADTWIFQINGDLTIRPNVTFLGKGGAIPQNILWAVSGDVNVGSRATLQGLLLSENDIMFGDRSQHLGLILSMNSVSFGVDAFHNSIIL